MPIVKEGNLSRIYTECTVDNCDKPIYVIKHLLCRGHYERWRKGTDLLTPIGVHNSKQGCKADNCEEKHHSYGYCKTHASRFRRGADLYRTYRKIDSGRGCIIAKCDKKHYGRDMCLNHYNRATRLGRKNMFVKEKGGKCTDCGNEFRPECFDFDNVKDEPGHVSLNTLLNRNASDYRIRQELKRCELVCACCHRTRTNKRYSELVIPLGELLAEDVTEGLSSARD